MSVARSGRWVGGEPVDTPTGVVLRGQMYVERLAGSRSGERVPVVMIHGGGGQGLDWLATPDGRPGWAVLLAQRGHDVYVVDRVGHGRSPYDPDRLGPPAPVMGADFLAGLFFPPADGPGSHPTSALHTQWPGDRTSADAVAHQFLAAQGPMPVDVEAAQRLDQAALVALLADVGPAVVFSHSAGGPAGFLVADARPDLVRALVACEPLGPPFVGVPGIPLPWGLTAAPVTYDPPADDAAQIDTVVSDDGPARFALQAQPPRRLARLADVPILLVTGEASPFRWLEGHTEAFLVQAGCTVRSLRLWEHGVHGNAHGFMLERNCTEILDLIVGRLDV